MGIYYAAPLLGPSMGPLFGGILTQLFNWRATFWFLVIFGVVSMVSFMLFKDTFRHERSLAYQAALQRIKQQMERERAKRSRSDLESVSVSRTQTIVVNSEERTKEKAPSVDAFGMSVTQTLGENKEKPAELNTPQEIWIKDINLSLKNINPVTPLVLILRRRNNVAILTASGKFSLALTIHG